MKRILVYGNSGAGKTFMARLIGNKIGVQEKSLDDVFWEPGGYDIKRPEDVILRDINTLNIKIVGS